MSLWKEFVASVKEEVAFDVTEEELAQQFLKDFDEYENLSDHIYQLATFIEQQFEQRYGREKGLWFLSDPDHASGKYNEIRATKEFPMGDERFDIEINSLELRWGTVADSEEEFDETIEDFITETKKRLDHLKQLSNGVTVTLGDIEDVLTPYLDREPTAKELELFKNYLEIDVPQWLVDNAKHWVKEVLPYED